MAQSAYNPTTEQRDYLTALEDMASMIQNAQTNLKKCPKQRLTEGYIKTRLKTIDEYWELFTQTHYNLTKCTPREQRGKMSYFLNEDFYKVEELYTGLQADLNDYLIKLEANKLTADESVVTMTSQNGQFVNLPRIQLPTFTGKYEEWPTYQDLFTALVHDTKLTSVQKLHYLKTSVSGEAELLLRHIQITENNYKQAWDLLKSRFGNKKMIANSILKRLFGQKKMINQSASQIKTLLDTTTECINNLNNLNINTENWDPVIIFLVGQRLDTESLLDWEKHAHSDDCDQMPKWEDMKKFLEAKFRTLELVSPATSSSREKAQTHKSFHIVNEESDDTNRLTYHASVNSRLSCTYCKGDHYIFNCKEFASEPVEQRQDFVKKNHLCFNCLVPYHSVIRCKQRTSCRICRKRHHSLLHQLRDTTQEAQSQPESEPEQKVVTAHFSREQPGHEVLLATARVEVKSNDGATHILRALIDQGSEASFISERVVQLLGLTRTNIKGVVSGVGEGTQIAIKHTVDLTISSVYAQKEIRVNAYVLKTISTRLPSKHISTKCSELQTLQLADPTYYTPGKIDILLGADVFCKIIEDGLVKMADGIVAQKTSLGWILSGQREREDKGEHNVVALHITSMVKEDNDMLRRFWEIETEVYKKKKLLTKEEEKCEEIYKNTTQRDEDGRYVVHLPLRQNIQETVDLCGETKQQAVNRFMQLEKRFEKSEKLKMEYTKVINEYKEMGHLKRSESQDCSETIYLPHLAVIREDKDTSKVRVVYDASAKGSNGHSLNDTMMIGPVLQPDLRSLIVKWRQHKICVVGDIVKMYRMIKMTEEHTNLQRIVWRDNPREELVSYNLTTVTFGTAAAPYLAVRTLSQLADDESHDYLNTAPIIKNSFYMDDLMVGNENIEKTKKMCEEIRQILKKGGFEMQKWSSNSEEVLQHLQEGSSTKDAIEIKLDKIIRILGLTWNRKDDAFLTTVDLPEMKMPITKRSILSDVARLFDPFGWLAPVIVIAKVLIQKLWLCNLEWDDKLTSSLCEEWIAYREELIHLRDIKIPRWLKTTHNAEQDVQLHGFADASTQAYAAVTYLRVVDNDKVNVTMIASRTKVAPLKQISVPKLELCAAALLAELVHDVAELLGVPKNKIFMWTDSMIVLSWLQSPPSRWRTFVANRTAEITRVIDNDRWRHVQSTDNPADIATRGIRASDLAGCSMWWNGPDWLKQENIEIDASEIPQTDLELKCMHNVIQDEKPIWERFSTMSRMKRVLAYCRRMLKKSNSEIREKYLTPNEMDRIEEECIRFYQNLVYYEEIEELKKKGQVKKRSSLITLSPFLDEKGLIRVKGRLHNASIAENTKHPIIIPNNQHLTKLIVNEAHTRTLHGWNQLMMMYVKSKYWVIGLKSAIRKCIHNCKICIIEKAKVKHQFMGQLPAARVNPHRAFLNSGVDYAGPILIRTSKGRGHQATKGYICLFVCMSTRAIHLEAVTDLTSQAFIAAFRRFVARRGYCQHLWSDNGTNFVGAAKELKDMFRSGKNNVGQEIAELLANDGTTWHFIPPKMPSHGGLWEAGVQSAKKHLARINKDTKLTYEEMATLLAQIEACLNSRPLCLIDDNTELPLTPGHFLVGEPLVSIPEISYEHKKVGLLTRWQLVQKMTQDFWHRWQTEYLNTLQQRYKWQVPVPSPSIGDVVVIKDELLPPTKWLLGRVKHLHPGADGLVRVVTVQCKGDHEFKRPLSKLILLPNNPQ